MQKKKSKKSWLRKQRHPCGCFYCVGDYLNRLIRKTRVRKKFLKYPVRVFEE